MKTYIKNLEWRYATKKFDTDKKIAPEDLEKILSSIQLSASAYGLQPYEIFVIEDPVLREQLKPAAWNQVQITEASHLLVFANLTTLNEKHINRHLENISKTRSIEIANLERLRNMLHTTVLQLSPEEQKAWTSKQAYIALGNLLSAAANYEIDACPMEGFDAEKFDEILDLKEKGLTTAVVAAIGYRSQDDNAQFATKVRKSKEELFHII